MATIFQTAAFFCCFALPLSAQPSANWVQGVVYERTKDGRLPLRGAFVSLSSSTEGTLATTRTDSGGRYRFVNLPGDRFSISASKPGYNTREATGRMGSKTILDCSKGCRQAGTDFELVRGAVITGVVLDAMGDPVSRAAVSARPSRAPAGDAHSFTGTTDDKGRFRIAGLGSGTYTLTVRRRAPSGQDETVTKDLSVEEGEQARDLQLTMGGQGSFRLTGNVSGIPFGEGYRTWVTIRPLTRPGRALQARVDPDGSIRFASLTAGRYAADAAAVKAGTAERTDCFLNTIDVQGDTDGITLQPVQAASAAGSVETTAGALPARVTLRIISKDGFGDRWAPVRGAGREFEVTGLRPGNYRIEAESNDFYVKGIKTAGGLEPPDEVVLSPGENRLAVVAAADHAQVFGTVLDPKTGQPLPHARVALSGVRGLYSVQSDQAGRFLFGKVVPGQYRICAWTNIAPERIGDSLNWQQTGCQPITIPIDPSGNIEIDVPATP